MATKEARGIEEPEPYGALWIMDRISDIMAENMAHISPDQEESSMSFQMFAAVTLDSAMALYQEVCEIKNPHVRELAKRNMDKHIVSGFTRKKYDLLDNPWQAPHGV